MIILKGIGIKVSLMYADRHMVNGNKTNSFFDIAKIKNNITISPAYSIWFIICGMVLVLSFKDYGQLILRKKFCGWKFIVFHRESRRLRTRQRIGPLARFL